MAEQHAETKIQYARVDALLLDPKNPRLGRHNVEKNLSQDDVLDLMKDWTLDELATSFLEMGASVILGKKHGGHRAIVLGDDVKLEAGPVAIDGEEPQALGQGDFILLPVAFTEIAPVAACVAGEAGFHIDRVQHIEGVARGDELAHRKQLRFHNNSYE